MICFLASRLAGALENDRSALHRTLGYVHQLRGPAATVGMYLLTTTLPHARRDDAGPGDGAERIVEHLVVMKRPSETCEAALRRGFEG
jgi:hypothetical protein